MFTIGKWKLTAILLALAAAFAMACGSGGGGAPTATPAPGSSPTPHATFPLTLSEADGQKLTLASAPQRIVSLSANATDIICSIGAGAQLVAVEKYANCPSGSQTKPTLDAYQPNVEAIVAYHPDLVYVSSDTASIVAALRNAGTPVLYLALPVSLSATLDQIRLFGDITGHAGEAASLASGLQQRIDGVKKIVSDVTLGPKVYHELDSTYYSAAPNSFVGDFYTILKAQNIAAGAADAYPQLSSEVIVQRNPDVIVLADEEAGVTAASVAARPGWSAITAVKNHRICVINSSLVSEPGPRIADALETLGKCIYPDRFK
ncbi:MAG TPA: helical backbone metal receptor [Dehalococcoidia bacterium]|nr:helical backbone metal receptor [Dehalococcoidia bacterium]